CKSTAVRVSLTDGYKFYCSRCGWNHEVVRRELSLTIKISLAVAALAVILALVVHVRVPDKPWISAAVLLSFSGLPLYHAFIAFKQMRKLEKSSSSFQPATEQSHTLTISEMKS